MDKLKESNELDKDEEKEQLDTEVIDSNRAPIIIVVIMIIIIILLGLAVAVSKKDHSEDEVVHLGFLNDVDPDEQSNNSEDAS